MCKHVQEINRINGKDNKTLKSFGMDERRGQFRYSSMYRLRYAYYFLVKGIQKKKLEIKPLSNGKADGLRATVTNIDEMHTYRREDHEKETVY